MGKNRGLSKKAKDLKAQILEQIEAERRAAPPELSEEPNFDVVKEAYDKLVKTDTSIEPIETTVQSIREFIVEVFDHLSLSFSRV